MWGLPSIASPGMRRNAFYRLVGYAPHHYRIWIIEQYSASLTHPTLPKSRPEPITR